MVSPFDSAAQKLSQGTDPFPLDALPKNQEDPLWGDIRNEYHLSLPEVSCLKNYAAPSRKPDVVALLEEAKGGPLTVAEIEYTFLDHAKLIDIILSKEDSQERSRLAGMLWKRVSVRIKTKTRLAVMEKYLFDGAVSGAFVAPGTEIQFVVKGSSVRAAKVSSDIVSLEREHSVANTIHENQTCPTVMPVIDLFRLPGEPQRVAMITPYYPLPLSHFESGNLHEEGCINVALCGLAAIKAFHARGICHGDVKPGNMMLTGAGDNLVVTIDFGSAVAYGQSLTSVTPEFGLDHPQEGSLTFDLTCLASSIYVLSTGEQLPNTSSFLVKLMESHTRKRTQPALQIAKCCLQSSDIDLIWKQAKSFVNTTMAINRSLDRSLIVPYDTVWPVSHNTA